MLLRRITKHTKDQNWTAVAIDFAIVVLGVFLGMQVSNWNEARQDRTEERSLLVRLLDESIELQGARESERANYQRIARSLNETWHVILSTETTAKLSQELCDAAATSHIVTRPSDDMPSLDDALGTDRIALIRSEEIQGQLRRFALSQRTQRSRFDELASNPFRLGHLYPEFFPIFELPGPESPGETSQAPISGLVGGGCNLQLMQSSPAFQQTLLDNSMRIEGLVSTYDDFDEELEKLKTAIEGNL